MSNLRGRILIPVVLLACLSIILNVALSMYALGLFNFKSRLSREEFLHWKRCRRHPYIERSLRPYRAHACRGRVTRSAIRRSVREDKDYIGVSIKDNHVTYYGTEGTPWENDVRTEEGLIQDIGMLAKEVDLPDMEFICWFNDGFDGLSLPNARNECLPVFVQEKPRSSNGILATPRSVQGFSDYILKTASQDNSIPLERKISKAFFRGTTTGGIYTEDNWRNFARTKIVKASLDHPDLIDARFTRVMQTESKQLPKIMKREGYVVKKRVAHSEQWKFKLVIVPDGNSVPDRLLDFLASNVVVLKQESGNEEFWYQDLKPYEHYIPFKRDVSDLVDVVKRSLSNETLLKHVSDASTHFVLENLNSDIIKCYLVHLLYDYAQVYDDD
ncbi:hypothetical protein GUITHDRAFT_121519 [Guillardia theta CCMP2712]|uniref:Glycosyl transferase CAP10 domain-containing protein n=1 Tax=Guillardia theta (strain CCMP2712) TaxID=905079 RepID=L1I905_GUITC|nr:hypothetical protein GUITHDRAFT_121519 [Guillardia theta CCMP2712]EKX32310.1 hypothetical protein GUITHDRAFT_121519 [Guillardia theta CCMP2712]|eukprot:XP_005819290.1 hypothetical protein GUITHDRAFT_121519 [Guillardia theta CCMP2712]